MVLTKKLIVAIVAVVIVLTAAGVAVGLNWDSITGAAAALAAWASPWTPTPWIGRASSPTKMSR